MGVKEVGVEEVEDLEIEEVEANSHPYFLAARNFRGVV